MRISLFFIFILGFTLSTHSWGFYGHRLINQHAVFLLPDDMYTFYRLNIHHLIELATRADERRYVLEEEASKHFIDLDRYERTLPIDTLPADFNLAIEKYSTDTLHEHGILPWNLKRCVWQLSAAFKRKDYESILSKSADIGHYIADAHVPLHTTSNYNGQLTDQHGIHALWESRLVELYAGTYDLSGHKAQFISDLDTFIWNIIQSSHALVSELLNKEAEVSKKYSSKYSFETRGRTSTKVYHTNFCADYHSKLDQMVALRLKESIKACSDLWYSAWVMAECPVLPESEIQLKGHQTDSGRTFLSLRNLLH